MGLNRISYIPKMPLLVTSSLGLALLTAIWTCLTPSPSLNLPLLLNITQLVGHNLYLSCIFVPRLQLRQWSAGI